MPPEATTEDHVYLDYNATAPLRAAVKVAMVQALEIAGNPSSVHQAGRAARAAVEQARAQVAAAVGAEPGTIVFTGGGSEANNMAILGSGAKRLLISATEHDSVLAPVRASGLPVEMLRVDAEGVVDLAALENALGGDAEGTLVALMLANNETGAIQPVAEAAEVVRAAGARLHCDAVQALGKIPVDVASLGAATVSLSAHKLGGPKGVGVLNVDEKSSVSPLISGGGQERRRRAGTENVPGIVGFGAAAEGVAELLSGQGDIAALRDDWEARVLAEAPEAIVFSAGADRLANTSCVALPGLSSETQLMALDLEGICVSAGSACSSGKVTVSHVLSAMGYGDDVAGSAIRVSLGWDTTADDIDRLVAAWNAMARRARRRKAG